MLPGISGSLIGHAFLESTFGSTPKTPWEARTIASLHRWWRQTERLLGPASGLRKIADVGAIPLLECLHYRLDSLDPHGEMLCGRATRESGPPVTVAVAPWQHALDAVWMQVVRAGLAAGTQWALVYTGPTLWVVDASRTWSRRVLGISFPDVLPDEIGARATVALLFSAGVGDTAPDALSALVHRGDRHGHRVCALLGDGVLEALGHLMGALAATPTARKDHPTDRAVLNEAVTIVYRLLFLLFAEARALVPTWHHLYRDAYTVAGLLQRLGTGRPARGIWKGLQAISRLAHTGCRAGDLVVPPFNGRLFSPRHAPLAAHARLQDSAVLDAIAALATQRGPHGRERVAYGDLDVEQLGSVYEHVLDYEPRRVKGALELSRTAHDRKASGSFYTPRAITDFLVRRTLHPLVHGRSADQILELRVLDPAMGSGAFLVAACRYLAHALEKALVANGELPRVPRPDAAAALRRLVAQRCLYGVDRNPMAVQLARLSLWLCTLSGDRPLTFLDHHLACGDSLIGASLADLSRAPHASRTRRQRQLDMLPLELDPAGDLSAGVLPERFRLALDPDDTAAQVRDKERALAALTAAGSPLDRWKQAADLWCAGWMQSTPPTPGVYRDVIESLTGAMGLLQNRQRRELVGQATSVARAAGAFHWEFEFPEVFFDREGHRSSAAGFDAVLGNPPWEMLRADLGGASTREHARREQQVRLRFLRNSRVYTCQSSGHTNTYQLFVERALQLVKPGGRLSLILPSGMATDRGSAALRSLLMNSTSVDRVFGFENREGLFPIHRDTRFLLVTATTSGRTDALRATFGLTSATWLDQLSDLADEDPPHARGTTMSRHLVERWDAEHLSWPWIRDGRDLAILGSVTGRVACLADRGGWHVTFGRELNATDDRHLFVPLPPDLPIDPQMLPIVEGKDLEPFRLTGNHLRRSISQSDAATVVSADRTWKRTRIAYRDVSSATNRLTLIAALLPAGVLSTHTVFCSRETLSVKACWCLLALLNSLVANYLVRLQVTTHVTSTIMARLPVPRPRASDPAFHRLAHLAEELHRDGVAARFAAFAELNALASHAYGLTAEQHAFVVSTFPLLPAELRQQCLNAFRTIS